MSDQIQAYAEKMEAELQQLDARIKEARANAKIKSADYQSRLEQLLAEARDRATKVKEAGTEAGGDLKQRLDEAMADLRRAWDQARS